ncbi:MAG: hypothetical protein QOJ48_2030 [Frankiales bacterium]|nr:hypothetical protein [Frankiales bacterium]
MSVESPHRILVLTDRTEPSPALLSMLRARADESPVAVRVLVPNPTRAEVRLLHPERHLAAEAAELALMFVQDVYEQATGSRVRTAVSLRHDPFEAVEEDLFGHDADEIVVAMSGGAQPARRFHHQLAQRLVRTRLPVTVVGPSPALA